MIDCLKTIMRIEEHKEKHLQEHTELYLPLPQANDQVPEVIKDMLAWIHSHFMGKL